MKMTKLNGGGSAHGTDMGNVGMMPRMFLGAALAVVMMCGCGPAAPAKEPAKSSTAFLELARARFSVRHYDSKPVEQEKIDAILEAARVAPTAKNQQPYQIYVLKSPEALRRINGLTRCAYSAPVVFMVCYDKSKAWTSPFDLSDNSGVMDTSIVGTHMMLEACEQGLGSCWVKYFDPKAVAKVFGIPQNLTPSFLLDVGYPAPGVAPSPMHGQKRAAREFVTYK